MDEKDGCLTVTLSAGKVKSEIKLTANFMDDFKKKNPEISKILLESWNEIEASILKIESVLGQVKGQQ